LEEEFQATETACRATRLVLALEARKLQHGSLPKSLDQLVGPYLDRLPLDPYSGGPFRYFPDGLTIPLTWHQPVWEGVLSGVSGDVPANRPFVWSSGAKIVWHQDPRESDVRRLCFIYTDLAIQSGANRPGYQYQRYRADWSRFPHSNYDVWEAGWAFPIP
jgi:hypothetical protein